MGLIGKLKRTRLVAQQRSKRFDLVMQPTFWGRNIEHLIVLDVNYLHKVPLYISELYRLRLNFCRHRTRAMHPPITNWMALHELAFHEGVLFCLQGTSLDWHAPWSELHRAEKQKSLSRAGGSYNSFQCQQPTAAFQKTDYAFEQRHSGRLYHVEAKKMLYQ